MYSYRSGACAPEPLKYFAACGQRVSGTFAKKSPRHSRKRTCNNQAENFFAQKSGSLCKGAALYTALNQSFITASDCGCIFICFFSTEYFPMAKTHSPSESNGAFCSFSVGFTAIIKLPLLKIKGYVFFFA